MQKRLVIINVVMSLLQVVIVTVVLFLLYRFLLKTINIEHLGIWSLVLATASVTQVANLGLSGGVVKFVAKYDALGEKENVSNVIQTAFISVAVFVGCALLLAYPLIKWIFGLVISREYLTLAIQILPPALFSFWLATIASVVQSSLDGIQRIYIRNLLMMFSWVFLLLLCYIIVPRYGLIGLTYAQIVNNFIILIISWTTLKKFLPELPIVPRRWVIKIFKEIVNYGINFQIVNIVTMLYEPLTKALLSKFGGLDVLGYYEMANRMVQQLRAFLVHANQVIVPFVANLHEKKPEIINSVYLKNYNLLFYITLPTYTLIATGAPLISRVWIGHYENSFVTFAILLSIGWFLNTLNVPSYFVNLGTGELRWNVISHISIAFLNAGLGILFGLLFDGYGVVIAWTIALSIGSSLVYLSYHITKKIPISYLLPRDSKLMLSFFIISVIYLLINQNASIGTFILLFMIALFTVLIYLYFNPMRRDLIEGIKEFFARNSRQDV